MGNYLDELTVSVHYDGKWNRDTQLAQMEEILKRLELCGKGIIKESEGRLVCTVDPVSYNSTRLRSFSLRSEDFSMHGLDRAGTIPQGVLRKENLDPCPRLVFEHLNVAYDGNIVPCCNMCSDVPGMEKWFYGNVMDRGGIFSAYTSPVAAEFRRNLFAPREQDQYTPEPCTTCAEGIYDFNENLVRSDCELRREMRPLIMQAWHSHL